MNWISVNDKLPLEKTGVLAWVDNGKGNVGFVLAYVETNTNQPVQTKWWRADATLNSSTINVTHWMELPQKP